MRFHISCAWISCLSRHMEAMRNETVGYLSCEFSQKAGYFLAHIGEISVEVISHKQHCKQLCGEMEIPCQLV